MQDTTLDGDSQPGIYILGGRSVYGVRTYFGAFAEDDLDAFAPALVDANKFPFDFGCDVAQQHVGLGMDVERWRYQLEQRLFKGELTIGEISEAGKFCATVVPCYSGPVIEALQGQVDILVGLELDDRQAAVVGGG